jgi:sugar transferase (PEP-CTERM/EpsH1 system associated)
MVSMNILFLAHRIPYPPDKGEKIRAYHELRFLASRHTVDLFAFADQTEQAKGRPALAQFCREMYFEELSQRAALARAALSLLTRRPFTTGYYYSSAMAKAVNEALAHKHYDAVFVYSSAMAPYVLDSSKVPVCVDFVDSDASKWAQYARYTAFPMSWVYGREACKLGRYEQKVARTARLSLVSTLLEIETIDPDGQLGVRALQNGVSLSAPVAGELPAEISALGTYVAFIGQMDYFPNVDAACYFAKQILPHIRRTHPDLRFVVVGRNPSPRVRSLTALPGVVVTGTVPDVQPYLRAAAAAVAPFRICQGVQNKILEALAIGLPVVATPRPARAVGASPDELLFVAQHPKEFAKAVVSVLETPQLRQNLSGRQFVERRFDWERNLEPLERWLLEAVGERSCTSGETVKYVAAC